MKQLLQKFGIDEDADLVTIHGELLKLQFLYTEALRNAEDTRRQDLEDTLQELKKAVATITILLDNVEKTQDFEYDFEESEKAFLAADYADLFGLYEGITRAEMEKQIVECCEHCEKMMESDNEEVTEKANHLYWTISEAKGLIQLSKAFITEDQLYYMMMAYFSLASIKGVDRSKMNMLFVGALQKNLECIKTIGNLCFINRTYKECANGWLAYAANNGMVESYYLYGNALAADKKMKEAVEWYDRYAESGRAFSMEEKNSLGMAYLMAKEYEKGLPYVTEAANAGMPNSMIGLGALYECGEQIEKDFQKALTCYEEAKKRLEAEGEDLTVVDRSIDRVRIAIADEQSGFDWLNLPMKKLYSINEYTKEKYIFEKVALIQNTYEKLSVLADGKKAEKAKRIVRLGTEIKNILVQQNLPEIRGGKYTYIDTVIDIFDILYNREGFQTIIKQFRKAMSGDLESLENTGFVCLFGFKDKQRAADWVNAACEMGSHTARLKFAVALQKENDYTSALKWFLEAEAAQEIETAELKYNLGICAFRAEERKIAADHVLVAANGGYKPAILTMGAFYEDGCGVEKNAEEALRYYLQARKLGVNEVEKYIEHLEQKMAEEKLIRAQETLEKKMQEEETRVEAYKAEIAEAPMKVETKEEILAAVKEHYEETAKAEASKKESEPKKRLFFRGLFGKKKKTEEDLETAME